MLYGQPDHAYYTSQIVYAAGCGRGRVQRELKKLTELGIIVRALEGRQLYYIADNRSPIFPEIRSIVRKTFGIAEVLRGALQPVANDIQSSFIFGAIDRKTDDRASDIDVMVIGNIHFNNEVVDQLFSVETELGREINTVVYPEAEFRQKIQQDHYFLKTVMDRSKIFLVGDEVGLKRLAYQKPV